MFKPVVKADFPGLEENVLSFWKDEKVFEKSVEARRGGERFNFYEGPPTANGRPGVHHILSRVFKDVILRYRTMKGYYVPRRAGWDTHGLPVELEVERELGFKSKRDIEEYGIARFNEHCKESVFRYLEDWNALTERIGFWIDLDHPYITMKNEYVESCWWALKDMWQKGLLYQGYRVAPHCPRCGTSLSSHELALGYRDDVEDPSLYVKFKVDVLGLDKPTFLLVWTTTPWTLPGNTALAVQPESEYAIVDVGSEYLVIARSLVSGLGLDARPVLKIVSGRELCDLEYRPLYDPHLFGIKLYSFEEGSESFKEELPTGKITYPVIPLESVSLEEGTGIVHIAPAFGEVDFEAGKKFGLGFVQHVDRQGVITGNYPFSDKFVKDADKEIVDDLSRRGLVFLSGRIEHTYPFCWRCETPLLYYAKESWYLKTSALRDRLISANEEINWYPEHIKYGRFGDWLRSNVDWAISRERYWGTPLPIWRCELCGYFECVGGIEELVEKPGVSGLEEPLDLHRPYIDKVSYECPTCRGKMRRVPEVVDVWFDSGAMPVAQQHYPFESKEAFFREHFPADYICEAVDQTRGWFYSLHAIAVMLFGRPSYRNVICLGHVLDANGEKMSKTKGNVVDPWSIINKYGVDAVRWYFFTASPPGNARRFSDELVSEVVKQFLLTLWNSYSFFVTYANIDHYAPTKEQATPSELDRWLMAELNKLVGRVDSLLAGYNPTTAAREIEEFVGLLSNWYIRRSRRRFWKSENDADKQAAYDTLYQTLVTLTKILAPFTPFLAEELYRNLVCSVFPDAPISVHHTDFPSADQALIDEKLIADTRLIIKLVGLGRSARGQAGIKVRQVLGDVAIFLPQPEEREVVARLSQQVLEELNIKKLSLANSIVELDKPGYLSISEDGYGVAVDTRISSELALEGAARDIVHYIQMMRRRAGFEISDRIRIHYQGDEFLGNVMSNFADYIKQETLSLELEKGNSEGEYSETATISGHKLALSISRLSG